MDKGYILAIVGLLMWGGHWMPWAMVPLVTNERGQLYRPLAYGYGCVCILAGFALWAATRGTTWLPVDETISFLVQVMVAAGIGTMLPRLVRWIWQTQLRRMIEGRK